MSRYTSIEASDTLESDCRWLDIERPVLLLTYLGAELQTAALLHAVAGECGWSFCGL